MNADDMLLGQMMVGAPAWLDLALLVVAPLTALIVAGYFGWDAPNAVAGAVGAAFIALMWPLALIGATVGGVCFGLFRLGGRMGAGRREVAEARNPYLAEAEAEIELELSGGRPAQERGK